MQAYSSASQSRRSTLATFRQRLTRHSSRQLKQLFGASLPRVPFPTDASADGVRTRHRLFNPTLIFWAFLMQILQGLPCRGAVQKIRLVAGRARDKAPSSDSSGYCQARLRLPIQALTDIFRHTAQTLQQAATAEHLWLGRHVRVVDCTNAKMPDTKKNQAAWPQPSVQKPGCGFPVVKILAVFSLATGAMLHFLTSPQTVHDAVLFKLVWDFFEAGHVVLADRAFASYAAIVRLQARGVDVVFRLSAVRRLDFRKGKHLGHCDGLFLWRKPLQCTRNMTLEELRALPPTLTVRILRFGVTQRGFRTQSVTLVTTLLDPKAYPAKALAELFHQRWTIELHFRDIKTTLRMEMLRCKSPAMIQREILVFFILHNLIRHLIWQSAQRGQLHIAQLSFKSALDLLINAAPFFIRTKPGSPTATQVYKTMLDFLAEDQLPDRPNRVEPRCIKRRPKPYQLMTQPRHQMREIPHRGKKHAA